MLGFSCFLYIGFQFTQQLLFIIKSLAPHLPQGIYQMTAAVITLLFPTFVPVFTSDPLPSISSASFSTCLNPTHGQSPVQMIPHMLNLFGSPQQKSLLPSPTSFVFSSFVALVKLQVFVFMPPILPRL